MEGAQDLGGSRRLLAETQLAFDIRTANKLLSDQ